MSTRISYLIVIAMLLQVYRHDISCILTQKKMPEKVKLYFKYIIICKCLENYIDRWASRKKRQRTIRNIKFIRGNLYALLLKDHLK